VQLIQEQFIQPDQSIAEIQILKADAKA